MTVLQERVAGHAFMERALSIAREQLGFGYDFPLPPGTKAAPAIAEVPTIQRPQATKKLPGLSLFPFQAEGVAWLKHRETALLADDMGLGKTVQAIMWATDRKPALVIVPAAVQYNWHDEIAKWRPTDSITVLQSSDDLPQKLSNWTVITYGMVSRYLPQLQAAGFNCLVLDEAHYIKNLDAKRTQAVLSLVVPAKPPPGARAIPSRLAVTGTPITNRPPELFPLLVFLGKMQRNEETSFLDRYTIRASTGGQEIFVGYQHLDQLHDLIKPFTLRRLKRDVLTQLPAKIYRPIYTALTNAAEYRQAETDFLNWLRLHINVEAAERLAFSERAQILVQLNYLRQLAAIGKVKPVADFLAPCGQTGHKVLIFSNFLEVLESLQERKGGIIYTGATSREERNELVKRFQTTPSECFFFGSIGAAGTGITLTAADRVVFVDLPWTPAAKSQAEDRIHRIGQLKTVEIVPFLARGTVDERIMQLISDKEKIIAQVIDGLDADRAALESVTTQLMGEFMSMAKTGQQPALPPSYIGDDEDEELQGFRQDYKPTEFEPAMIHEAEKAPNIVPEEWRGYQVDLRVLPSEAVKRGLGPVLKSAEELQPLFRLMRQADREYLMLIFADTKLRLIGVQVLAIGTRNAALVPFDAIARSAILLNAANVFLSHNHPSGDSTPSLEDKHVLETLRRALKPFEIAVPDGIVVGWTKDYSIEYGKTFDVPKGQTVVLPPEPTPRMPLPRLQPALLQGFRQNPDTFGSRCRNPETGEWTFNDLCPPVEELVTRDRILMVPPATTINHTLALSADGLRTFEFEHRIVEAEKLIPSHDPFTFMVNPAFTQALQPRQRDRMAAEVQVKKIAAELSPASLLTDFHTVDRGAPIVGSDLLVESGNGRVMGIIRSIQEWPENYAAYRLALSSKAPEYGLSIGSMKHPVLVRVRLTKFTPQERQAFVQEANTPSGLTRSAIEQARTDGEKITLSMLSSIDVAEGENIFDALRAQKNAGFLRAFMAGVPENERGQLVDAKGVISMDGIRRAVQAIFVSAFGSGEPGMRLGEMAFESADQDVRTAINAVAGALAPLAQMEAVLRARPEGSDLSIASDLAQAISVYAKIRNDPNLTVQKYFDQYQLLERELSPFGEAVLQTLDRNKRSAKRMSAVLRAYANLVLTLPPPEQVGLFGPVETPPREAIWGRAIEQVERTYEEEREERERRREKVLAVAQEQQAAKEPWQMTTAEYQDAWTALNRRPSMMPTAAVWPHDKVTGRPLTVSQVHREVIGQALSEGKPVPAEVLAEYPDLKPQAPSPETRGSYSSRIRWCNTKPDDRKAILAWRPLRNLIYMGVGYQVAVEVCEAGFAGGQYQVTIGYPAEGGTRKGYLTPGQLQALRRVTQSMGVLVKEVLTKDPGLLVFNVTLPGEEPAELVLKPQLPESEEAARLRPREKTMQPSLFQSGLSDSEFRDLKTWRYGGGEPEGGSPNYRKLHKMGLAYRDYKKGWTYTTLKGSALVDQVEKEEAQRKRMPLQPALFQQLAMDSRLPLCSPAKQKKLERLILKLKEKNQDLPANRQVNPWAVAQAALACRRRRPVTQGSVFPWPESWYDEEEDGEDNDEEGKMKQPTEGWRLGWQLFANSLHRAARSLEAEAKQIDRLELVQPINLSATKSIIRSLGDDLINATETGRRTHFSQSFLDTIVNSALATATSISVAKALSASVVPSMAPSEPTLRIVDTEETKKRLEREDAERKAKAAAASVLSPAVVEGDQAQVDLGTLLQEIDEILKRPDTMGIVDATTLKIVRA